MQNAKQKRAQKCGHKVLTSVFCHPTADPKQKARVSQDHFETEFVWAFFCGTSWTECDGNERYECGTL